MNVYLVSNHDEMLRKWFDDSITIISARDYITNPDLVSGRNVKVYNLCSDIGYQQQGYYVSLLAEARRHKVVPGVGTWRDFNDKTMVVQQVAELDDLIQKSLAPLQSDTFVLSIYFARNLAKRYDKLCSHIFGLFPAPLMRAHFQLQDGRWRLKQLLPLSVANIPEDHQAFFVQAVQGFFSRKLSVANATRWRYDLAILVNAKEKTPPSDSKALQRFANAAQKLGMRTEFIEKKDYARLGEFDALFIRETTQVDHHTYRFARRAEAEGLVVIDDPNSILRCTNKVYLAELLTRHQVSIPKTMVVHKDNAKEIATEIGFPCILKQPDSSFSQGVFKCSDEAELKAQLKQLFKTSSLLIVQEFMPTPFDWRVGTIDQRPLYASKYFMASKHWQIRHEDDKGRVRVGKDEAVPIGWVPQKVIKTALKAADLIGDGLYGVDLKEVDGRVVVIEVNDNPSIDGGVEDTALGDELYHRIMATILERIEERKKRI